MAFTIRGYEVGRKTFRGEPREHETVPVVTCVQSLEIIRFSGGRNRGEVTDWLRRLRADGKLICQPGRLTAWVRLSSGSKTRMYVIRGEPDSIPRIRRPRIRRARAFRA